MKKIKQSWTTSDDKVFFNEDYAIKHQDRLNFTEFINGIFDKHRNKNNVYKIDHVPYFLVQCQDLFENYFKERFENSQRVIF